MMGFFGKSKSSQPEKTHPALRLKAEMDEDAVIGLLGMDYRSTTRDPLEYWLYSSDRYDIEIIFRSGALKSAEVKKKAGGKKVGATTVVRWAESDQEEGLVEADVVRIVNGRPVHVPGSRVRFVNGHPVPVPERPESQKTGMTARAKSLTSRPTTPDYPGKVDRFKAGEVESLVHFLDEKPLAFCFEHRGSSACLGYKLMFMPEAKWTSTTGAVTASDLPFSEDCPLCRSGDKPEFYAVFNVVVMAQSQEPGFASSAIILGGRGPLRRPALKLWFAPIDYRDKIRNGERELGTWKPRCKMDNPDVYFWVTKHVIPITADQMAGEEFRTRPLTWGERHEFSLAKWTAEPVMTRAARLSPGAELRSAVPPEFVPRMSLRRPDRRT
jgi:hypothetical protein